YSGFGSEYDPDLTGSGDVSGLDTNSAAPGAGVAESEAPARVSMTLPAGATLWAQGKKITGSGASPGFPSPPVEAGRRFAYDFQASWKENGRTVTQEQTVVVTAGGHVQVHFPVQPTKAPAVNQAGASPGRAAP